MFLTYISLAIIFAAIISLVTRAVIYAKLTSGKIFMHRGFAYKAMILLKNSGIERVEK